MVGRHPGTLPNTVEVGWIAASQAPALRQKLTFPARALALECCFALRHLGVQVLQYIRISDDLGVMKQVRNGELSSAPYLRHRLTAHAVHERYPSARGWPWLAAGADILNSTR